MPDNAVKPEEHKDTNVFTSLFKAGNSVQKAPEKPQEGSAETSIMDTITKKHDQDQGDYFVDRNDLNTTVEKKKHHFPKSGQVLVQAGLMLLFSVSVFFFTQNNERFEVFKNNPAQKAIAAQELVDVLNAEIVVQKHLAAVLQLEAFVTRADAYFYQNRNSNSEFLSQTRRNESAVSAESTREELGVLVGKMQENLSDKLSTEQVAMAREIADDFIGSQKQKLDEDGQSVVQDIQDFESTKKLIQTPSFKKFVSALDAENLSDAEIKNLTLEYGTINRNLSTLISEIRSKKKDWSGFIAEIERTVKTVDPLFGTEFQGSLSLQNMTFNSNGRVTLSGAARTDDAKNFTVLSNLVDALERTTLYEQVSQRNFAKTETGETNVTGAYSIQMYLTESNEE